MDRLGLRTLRGRLEAAFRSRRTTGRPRVSVIVTAHNAMPELTRCVASAREQTLGPGQLEIVVVDDGSTDGTADELARLVRDCRELRTVRLAHSREPGRPRNTGLALARGEFVLFLDPRDRLAPDALRRMTEAADESGTDVVLGRAMRYDGSPVAPDAFRESAVRTDVLRSRAHTAFGSCALFRAALIERLGLRFPESCRYGEQWPFTAAACLTADAGLPGGISVVADTDCYRLGPRGTRRPVAFADRADALRLWFDTLARHTEPGPTRDAVARHLIAAELCAALRALPSEQGATGGERHLPELRGWIRAWCTEPVLRALAAPERLLVHLLCAGRFTDLPGVVRNAEEDAARGRLVDKGRVYWLHPFFRDPEAAVPDSCFDITDTVPVHHRLDAVTWRRDGVLRLRGHAAVDGIDAEGPNEADGVEVVLRDRGSGRELRLPTTGAPDADRPVQGAGFRADIDVTAADGGGPLGPGVWDVLLDVRAQHVSRTVRFGGHLGETTTGEAPRRVVGTYREGPLRVAPRRSASDGGLSLHIDRAPHRLDAPCEVTGAAWHPGDPGALVVTGRLRTGFPVPVGALRLRVEDADGQAWELPARYGEQPNRPADTFTVRLPMRELTNGRWTLTMVLDGPADGRRRAVPVPRPARLGETRWHRGPLPYEAEPLDGEALTLRVGLAPARYALRRRGASPSGV